MVVLNELLERKIPRSKRDLSRLLGRAPNYVCEGGGRFSAIDLIELRLHLMARGGHEDLVAHLERLILSSWRRA